MSYYDVVFYILICLKVLLTAIMMEDKLSQVCCCNKNLRFCFVHARTQQHGLQKFSFLHAIYIQTFLQIVGIPMGTNCAPLVADLFLYCYERDFMDSLNHDNQADVIEAFNSTSRYLDDLLNIDNPYFEGMVNQISVS